MRRIEIKYILPNPMLGGYIKGYVVEGKSRLFTCGNFGGMIDTVYFRHKPYL